MALVSLAALVASARSGRVVCFPTDTVPALGVAPAARSQIYRLKDRPEHKPLILMAAHLEELWEFVEVKHPQFAQWQAVGEKFFPGAITLVLPANAAGRRLNGDSATIGVRIPASVEALRVLQQTGPLLTTSANRSNTPPLLLLSEINLAFPGVCVLRSDRQSAWGSGEPSTVVAWQNDRWQILRPGGVAFPLYVE